ncbi:MAG TPA: FN3 associated domain-containing protein [Chitinophagaceae bacterium]|nr:FN3 associated domain-containing protein [Chitinophagaceae bacterium]
MQRWHHIVFTITIVLNLLLAFFLLFESGLVIPAWLQVGGRMHPLLLHFPIVLIVLYLLLLFILPAMPEKTNPVIQRSVLLLAAFTSALTAIMGLFLSLEAGYDGEALRWHKWSGAAVSFFVCAWYYLSGRTGQRKAVSLLTALAGTALVTIAGHEGASITHGEGFLLAPLAEKKKVPAVSLEEANVYTHLVKPILEGKCMSCHNEKKAKGELIMETEALLLKGGKNGPLWDTAAADLGLMLRRIHLPEEDEDHMPPAGKIQLTDSEISVLTAWIKKGSDFRLQVSSLPPGDTLRILAAAVLGNDDTEKYDFAAADAATVQRLNTENRVVTEDALQSPTLHVQFFNSQLFKPEQLKELSDIKNQIISLDLSRMPVEDKDLALISGMENLRKLYLNFTKVTGTGFQHLQKLKHLHTLSLSGAPLSAGDLPSLTIIPGLKKIYLWNIPSAANAIADLQKKKSGLIIETGYPGDTTMLKLSDPVILNEELIITGKTDLKIKHYIQQTQIRYTLDGSEPDSILSPLYNGNTSVEGNITVNAKAFKPGWHSSNTVSKSFFQARYSPDSASLITQPDPAYSGKAAALTDRQKGELNFRNGSWLAWRHTKMETGFYFNKPVTISSVSLSVLTDIGSYIMPPQAVEVWGGDDAGHLKLLGKVIPKQPGKSAAPYMEGVECRFTPVSVSYIKIIGHPVSRLPAWHPGKGDKGWLFTDEVFFN